ncbi:hypothetical protein [Sphingomonas sp. VNH70]|uniref:hypothetical protein n=1 Tax=Sphingomonas silueang TaxID=3156617 RepID=UPI0032B38D3C
MQACPQGRLQRDRTARKRTAWYTIIRVVTQSEGPDMSRYELDAHLDRPEVSHAVVGWDRPLATYFVQVFLKDTDEIAYWWGAAPGEVTTADAAIALVAPFAVVPGDLAANLRRDVAEQPVRPPNHPMVGRRVRVRREGQATAEGQVVQAHIGGFFVRLDNPASAKGSASILVFHDDIEIIGD